MKIDLRSLTSTGGRRMAGARSLWRANGMTDKQMGKPIIAIVNSFTQFVPGHVHLHEIGQKVKAEVEKLGCFAGVAHVDVSETASLSQLFKHRHRIVA